MLAKGAVRQSGRPREAAAAPLAATKTDDEKPAPANRSRRGTRRGNSPAQASAATDVEILTAKWHLLSPEIRVAIMAIFYSSQKAESDSSAL
jgi:hypothetical protein